MAGATKDISEISIGRRHRKDIGDIGRLAESIRSIGLLHPIVVTPKGKLIAGERRLAACKEIGWQEVPVTVVDLDDIVKGEFAENAIRKDFLPSEIEAIRRAMAEKVATPVGRPPENKENFLNKEAGQTRDKIGAFAGISGRTVEKIAAVHKAAKDEPERFGYLPEQMDKTGKVDPAYAVINRKKKHTAIAIKAADIVVPGKVGPFSLIYADPPWKWGHFGEKDKENEQGKGRTPDQHYETLTYDDIKAFRVGSQTVQEIAHKDAVLLLWCTAPNMISALDVMEAWGFDYKTHFVWVKFKTGRLQTGMGLVTRNAHEVLLYGTRGKMPGPQYQPPSVFLYPRGRHSAKPLQIRGEIEKMFPDFDKSVRAELFAREPGAGWSCFGHESQ